MSWQAGKGLGLHVQIDNPSGVVMPAFSSEINEDDWIPGMTDREAGNQSSLIIFLQKCFIVALKRVQPVAEAPLMDQR